MSDFFCEIKNKEENFKIKEINGCYYIDSSLLSLEEDGIHLIYEGNNHIISSISHDNAGYFLSPQACWDLGNKWMCCRCNNKNNMLHETCRICFNVRCKK